MVAARLSELDPDEQAAVLDALKHVLADEYPTPALPTSPRISLLLQIVAQLEDLGQVNIDDLVPMLEAVLAASRSPTRAAFAAEVWDRQMQLPDAATSAFDTIVAPPNCV